MRQLQPAHGPQSCHEDKGLRRTSLGNGEEEVGVALPRLAHFDYNISRPDGHHIWQRHIDCEKLDIPEVLTWRCKPWESQVRQFYFHTWNAGSLPHRSFCCTCSAASGQLTNSSHCADSRAALVRSRTSAAHQAALPQQAKFNDDYWLDTVETVRTNENPLRTPEGHTCFSCMGTPLPLRMSSMTNSGLTMETQ